MTDKNQLNELDYNKLTPNQQRVIRSLSKGNLFANHHADDWRTFQSLVKRGWVEGLTGSAYGTHFSLTPAGRAAYEAAMQPTPPAPDKHLDYHKLSNAQRRELYKFYENYLRRDPFDRYGDGRTVPGLVALGLLEPTHEFRGQMLYRITLVGRAMYKVALKPTPPAPDKHMHDDLNSIGEDAGATDSDGETDAVCEYHDLTAEQTLKALVDAVDGWSLGDLLDESITQHQDRSDFLPGWFIFYSAMARAREIADGGTASEIDALRAERDEWKQRFNDLSARHAVEDTLLRQILNPTRTEPGGPEPIELVKALRAQLAAARQALQFVDRIAARNIGANIPREAILIDLTTIREVVAKAAARQEGHDGQ